MSESADGSADDEVTKTPVVPEIDPKPVVYLAGAVQDHPDPVGWREDIIEQFSDRVAFKNPLGRYECAPGVVSLSCDGAGVRSASRAPTSLSGSPTESDGRGYGYKRGYGRERRR